MSKPALLFAGQGAQQVGMGRDLAEAYPAARARFAEANDLLGYDLRRVCFEGPEAELTRTDHAQPALFLVGWIAFELLRERVPDLAFAAAAGLSLGEFTALAAAGSLSFADGLRLVRHRGCAMQEACETTRGGMAAILGLAEAPTRAVCDETGVELANLNCPGQIVISGPADRMTAACDLAKARGAKRAVPLPVAGAYHSTLMAAARGRLASVLATTALARPRVPVISNVTARPHGELADLRRLLAEQVTSPVRWEDSMRCLLAQGFTRFVELGPGTTLTGFLRRIDKTAQALNVMDTVSLDATARALGS